MNQNRYLNKNNQISQHQPNKLTYKKWQFPKTKPYCKTHGRQSPDRTRCSLQNRSIVIIIIITTSTVTAAVVIEWDTEWLGSDAPRSGHPDPGFKPIPWKCAIIARPVIRDSDRLKLTPALVKAAVCFGDLVFNLKI